MRGVDEFLELSVGYRCAVDVEGFELQPLAMKAARRVFPWILDVDARVVAAFDFDSTYGKIKIAARNTNHAGGSGDGWFGRGQLNHSLGQIIPFARVPAERAFGALGHNASRSFHSPVSAGASAPRQSQGLRWKIAAYPFSPAAPGVAPHLPEIVVVHAVGVRYAQLLTREVVFVAIDHCP